MHMHTYLALRLGLRAVGGSFFGLTGADPPGVDEFRNNDNDNNNDHSYW